MIAWFPLLFFMSLAITANDFIDSIQKNKWGIFKILTSLFAFMIVYYIGFHQNGNQLIYSIGSAVLVAYFNIKAIISEKLYSYISVIFISLFLLFSK